MTEKKGEDIGKYDRLINKEISEFHKLMSTLGESKQCVAIAKEIEDIEIELEERFNKLEKK